MDVSVILNDLNDAQREAVAASAGNQLVLAGAGSGKTRVLVHRIAWLITVEGASPHNIMAVTFTNKAAREMRGRIGELLSVDTRSMWVGTFHGIAHRLLKAHWREAGLPEQFQILDADDQQRLVKRVLRELELDETRWPPRQATWFINGQKDEGLRASHLQERTGDLFHNTMLRIYRAYEEACERQGVVDFAELLLRANELWLKQPAVLAHYQQRFRFLLVDEFQDTNAIQYAWLRNLASDRIPVVAVGDDDQSIYGWRGARIENIQQFGKDFAPVTTVRLEQNYRSSACILDAANAVIANNHGRMGKNLWTTGERGEPISLYSAYNEQDEARFVVERIEDALRGEQLSRSEIALLYRSNAQSRVLEEALIRSGIPYRIYGGQRFYERLEIKNSLAYLRLLLTCDDDTAVERVINTPTRGIGNKTIEALRERARGQGVSLWRAAQLALASGAFPARAANALQGFISLIEELHNETAEMDLEDIIEHVNERSGLIEFHRSEKGEKGQARVENLEELVAAGRSFQPEEGEPSPLQQFLDQAALDAGEQQADEYEDSVQLMTLHSAKGLEFPLVFLVGMEENLFPHRMSMEDPERLEEERRLCYVGITRAMRKLYICYAETRRLHGNDNFNLPSRFIREIPGECIDEVRLHASVSRPIGAGRFTGHAVPDTGITLGQRVLHQVFGEGVVLNFEGQGPSARVQVNFADEGSKWLVLQYANLEAI